ncbi:hypothetical protein TNIN_102131 [Trichonephila inaurata madagascariensis]|uniref:Uncharacterized protein n=1 Tax=Trichonephila inaurata madagascariensis TaxID=2747483 RepID=A0A8X7CSR2_9ARAC|nr:hypothetical protein TNIN_102131 [Trichonephila inaurata madagascariensis]
MATLRERSFSSQLLLSLSVLLYRRYGSERLIDVPYSLGFAASYGTKFQQFTIYNLVFYHRNQNLPNLDQLAQVFQEENCYVKTLHENGIRVLLTIYNAPQSENSIDNLRHTQFIKLTKLNKPVQFIQYSANKCSGSSTHQPCILSSSELVRESFRAPGMGLDSKELILGTDYDNMTTCSR